MSTRFVRRYSSQVLTAVFVGAVLTLNGCAQPKPSPIAQSTQQPAINWTPPPGSSEADKQAAAALNRNDYPAALRLLRPLAEHGDSTAPLNLGQMYDNGLGVPQDYVEAVKWYSRAADQGDTEAQALLGTMYARGLGVSRDFEAAVKWFRQSADRGYPGGLEGLGIMYEYGRGVSMDNVQAYKWYSLAADRVARSSPETHSHFIQSHEKID